MAYDNLKLEKGLYTTGKSFTSTLEELDPSENYKGTSLEGLDAFERQLKRFDIKVSGPESDTISKFFKTTDSAALFPEYISRVVKQGILGDDRVERIVATTTVIDGLDYRSIQTNQTDDDLSLSETIEGNYLPKMEIKTKSELTKLKKYGKMISATYEAIKFQKLDLFSLTLRRIGEYISNCEFANAVETAANDCEAFVSQTGTFTYDELVNLWTSLYPFNMTTLVVNNADMKDLLKISEFRDATAGLDFHGTGRIITPFGAEIIRCAAVPVGTIVALDKNYAVEKVQAGGIVTDYDKLIDCQLERATISTIVGFSPIYNGATKTLSVTA